MKIELKEKRRKRNIISCRLDNEKLHYLEDIKIKLGYSNSDIMEVGILYIKKQLDKNNK